MSANRGKKMTNNVRFDDEDLNDRMYITNS